MAWRQPPPSAARTCKRVAHDCGGNVSGVAARARRTVAEIASFSGALGHRAQAHATMARAWGSRSSGGGGSGTAAAPFRGCTGAHEGYDCGAQAAGYGGCPSHLKHG